MKRTQPELELLEHASAVNLVTQDDEAGGDGGAGCPAVVTQIDLTRGFEISRCRFAPLPSSRPGGGRRSAS